MMRSPRGNAGDRSWKCAREEELSCLEVPVYVYDRSLVGSLLEDLSTLYVHNGNFRVLCFLLRRSRPTDCEVLFHQGMVLIFFFFFCLCPHFLIKQSSVGVTTLDKLVSIRVLVLIKRNLSKNEDQFYATLSIPLLFMTTQSLLSFAAVDNCNKCIWLEIRETR